MANWQVVRLTSEPAAEAIAPNHHSVKLSYKTNKDGVKRADVWYMVPDLEAQFPILCEDGQQQIAAMFYSLAESERRERLYELEDGELRAMDWCADIAKLAERFFIDGRSLGVKQEAIEEWIKTVLQPAMMVRVNKSMAGVDQAKRDSLVRAVTEQFQIAATRDNKLKNKTLTEVALRDLQSRLSLYKDQGSIAECDELTAIQARIAKHLSAEKVAVEVVETF